MSNKLDLDKYYTPCDTAKYCIDKVYDIIGTDNINQSIEPSAGNGSFSLQLDNCIAIDIAPEHNSIIKQDFLSWDKEYQKGVLIIGNPPFGSRMNLAQKFFKKSITLGDYIAFILPISQLWNTNSLFEFDLVHSEDLGKIKYSDRSLKCCFNIYKRPNKVGFNKKPKNKLKTVKIVRQDSKAYITFTDFDLRMCYWGNGSAGKILKEGQSYSAEYKLKVDAQFKDEVVKVLSTVNWFDELNCIAMLKIQQFHIINTLKKYIPNIN